MVTNPIPITPTLHDSVVLVNENQPRQHELDFAKGSSTFTPYGQTRHLISPLLTRLLHIYRDDSNDPISCMFAY
jgi:hypothetical protein